MKIATETGEDGVAVAIVKSDEIDASNYDRFKNALVGALDTSKRVVVDLTQVRFIDSSGLGALLAAQHHAAETGGRFILCGLTPYVKSLFETVRLDTLFQICEDTADALASFE